MQIVINDIDVSSILEPMGFDLNKYSVDYAEINAEEFTCQLCFEGKYFSVTVPMANFD